MMMRQNDYADDINIGLTAYIVSLQQLVIGYKELIDDKDRLIKLLEQDCYSKESKIAELKANNLEPRRRKRVKQDIT